MVEIVALESVCSFNRGRTITAKNAVKGEIPVIAGGQAPSYYHNEPNRIGESITIAGSGAYAGFVSYWNQPIYVSDAFTVDPSEKLIHKYLFHWLKMNQQKIFLTQKGAGVPHVHGKDIANFQIPIPTIEVQTRIVEILDTFTSSISNLKEQIKERRKQYEYYRDQLLDLEGKDGVEMKTLGEICEINRGVRVVKKDLEEEGIIPVFQNSLIPLGYYEKSNYPANTAFVISAGAAGDVGFSFIPFWAADDCLCITCPNTLLDKYVFVFLQSKQVYLKSKVRKGAVPRLSRTFVEQLVIPVLFKEEQLRIVTILDQFEASIANLEAQLKEREKQYEYYRNQLLTFE